MAEIGAWAMGSQEITICFKESVKPSENRHIEVLHLTAQVCAAVLFVFAGDGRRAPPGHLSPRHTSRPHPAQCRAATGAGVRLWLFNPVPGGLPCCLGHQWLWLFVGALGGGYTWVEISSFGTKNSPLV